jgi:hypothetical protein
MLADYGEGVDAFSILDCAVSSIGASQEADICKSCSFSAGSVDSYAYARSFAD